MTPLRSPMASEALITRFMSTWRIWVASASMAGRSSARWKRSSAFLEMETCSMWVISRISSFKVERPDDEAPLPE